jgi:pimeloyl-ACP methyl ester carboxylesterase
MLGRARPVALFTFSAALATSAVLAGCLRLRPAVVPMATRSVSEPGASPGRCLVVFLPGRRDSLGAFRTHEFPRMAREAGVSADYLEGDAHLAYYADETITKRLRDDVIEPARAKGADRIWIVGISMGGLGGILYAREHPEIAGVVALSPFLGDTEPGLVAKAGGLARYTTGAKRQVADYERELWGWLKEFTAAGAPHPPVYLGWGESDDLAPADKLLGDALPRGRVFTVRGKHDWRTWTDLWRQFLRTGELQRACGGAQAAAGAGQP